MSSCFSGLSLAEAMLVGADPALLNGQILLPELQHLFEDFGEVVDQTDGAEVGQCGKILFVVFADDLNVRCLPAYWKVGELNAAV